MVTRQPIVVVLGHVDHGKTSILDRIRKTRVAKREVGGITQHVGASEVPAEVIKKICGNMLERLKINLTIPGLLFIDTPGHAAFTAMRERGGTIADIAIVVVDFAQGFQPQTLEALKILKNHKTPFILAANKIDLTNGWLDSKEESFTRALEKQSEHAQAAFEERMYELVGRMHELGFESERFDRVTDFTKQVTIVPVSAKTGEGILELLLFLAGLSQRFLEKQLQTEVKGPGRGSILEVKKEAGLGITIDVILYDGMIRKNDRIVFGTLNGAESTNVRGLLKPKPLDEMRDAREKFDQVDVVYAASGVKIYAPGLDNAISGSPVLVVDLEKNNEEELRTQITKEISSVFVSTDAAGVVLKADTIGSVEAITKLFDEAEIVIRTTGIGPVAKKDIVDAEIVKNEDRYKGVIMAFNVTVPKEIQNEADSKQIPIISEKIIYDLILNYEKWKVEEREKEKKEAFTEMVLPCKIKILREHIFRISKPAIVGVRVLGGRLRSGVDLVKKDGTVIGTVKAIQHDKKSVNEAEAGKEVAISIEGATAEKDFNEDDELYANIPKRHLDLLEGKYSVALNADEQEVLQEFKAIFRKQRI
ncbi:putative translation initiation factor IF-2 [Candidatus Gugararchaeum adminiculabundum]|nr:putative translation initiation factor IF-2 [Candidatus Gugararchaeum adminiculabundum]